MFKSFCILNRSEYLKFQISGTFPLLVEWFKDGELLENCQNIQIVNQDDMFLMKVRNTILQLWTKYKTKKPPVLLSGSKLT